MDNFSDRQAILALRNDPQTSALMEGEFANQCRSQLQGALGHNVCNGELYAAHFLGTDAAAKLIRMSQSQPNANAAAAFPGAADANQNVFYHADGTAKTAKEVYDWALKQPSGSKVLASTALPTPAKSNAAYVTANSSSGYSSDQWAAFQTLDGMGMGGSFASTNGLPNAPFALTSDVIDVLASMSPDGAEKQSSH